MEQREERKVAKPKKKAAKKPSVKKEETKKSGRKTWDKGRRAKDQLKAKVGKTQQIKTKISRRDVAK